MRVNKGMVAKMDRTINGKGLEKLLNPRRIMDSDFRSLLFGKITEFCSSPNELAFFNSINSKVKDTYFLFDFSNNYSQVKQRISDVISVEWQNLERLEILNIIQKSTNIKENEKYLLLLSIDLSDFIINGNWQCSEIDITSHHSYVIVFTSELNKILSDRSVNLSTIVDDVKPLIIFYKKERLLECFLKHFNSIDWYVNATIRLSREFLRYSKINSKYQLRQEISEKSHIEDADIGVMKDEMLTMLMSRIRELFLDKSNENHSSAFSYIIKNTRCVGVKINKKQFTNRLESISNHYKDELRIFSIKRNKENFHITTYEPTIVIKENTIQSETTINIPKVYEILDAFVDIYEDYRQIVIKDLSLPNLALPKRVKIKKTKLGDLYLKYTYK
jgi:hypothetical protein